VVLGRRFTGVQIRHATQAAECQSYYICVSLEVIVMQIELIGRNSRFSFTVCFLTNPGIVAILCVWEIYSFGFLGVEVILKFKWKRVEIVSLSEFHHSMLAIIKICRMILISMCVKAKNGSILIIGFRKSQNLTTHTS